MTLQLNPVGLPRCDKAIAFSLRVVGAGEVVHSWRQCKRPAVVSIFAPHGVDGAPNRLHRAPLCGQHWRRLVAR